LYGDKKDPVSLSIDYLALIKELNEPGILSHIYDLNINGKKQKALIRDIQLHPITDRPVHVDFMRISEKSEVNVDVPVKFLNEDKCPGIKQGGVLNILRHAIHVVCPATSIPEAIEIDLEGLTVGTTFHTNEINLPANVTLSHLEKSDSVASIVPPKVSGAKDDEEEESGAEEGSEEEASEESAE
jgi:large subunit ribosomal protein L25